MMVSVARGQLGRDDEAVDVGQRDVQQDHVGAQQGRSVQGRRAVGRLPDDGEAVVLQQRAGNRAELRVVVDDQGPSSP